MNRPESSPTARKDDAPLSVADCCASPATDVPATLLPAGASTTFAGSEAA